MTVAKSILLFALATFCAGSVAQAASTPLQIFESAKERAYAGLARQRARKTLTEASYRRAQALNARGVISAQEFDILQTAAKVAQYDLKIAEATAEQATIALDLAKALDRAGKRIPLCKRKSQSNEDSVTALLKSIDRKPLVLPTPNPIDETFNTGTAIRVPDPEPPQPPNPVEPNPPTPPENNGSPTGGGTPGGGPDPGPDVEPPPATSGGSGGGNTGGGNQGSSGTPGSGTGQ